MSITAEMALQMCEAQKRRAERAEAERDAALRAVADLSRINRLIVRGKLVVPAATVHNKHIAVIEAARKLGGE